MQDIQSGYYLRRVLNNPNRHDQKLVLSMVEESGRLYVSTRYANSLEYLKFLKSAIYLQGNNKLSPQIIRLFPEAQTVICEYIGEFLYDYLLSSDDHICPSLVGVFAYLQDLNSLQRTNLPFIIPGTIKNSLQLSEEFAGEIEFLERSKRALKRLENSQVQFTYGCGIEDPHIWNFRVAQKQNRVSALTTDFDYFSNRINCFWELGYFYATFRWIRKDSPCLAAACEQTLLSLVRTGSLKSEFMFWLGVLSSYCGYKDSILNLMINGGIGKLQQQYLVLNQLDEIVSSLSERIL